MPDNLKSGISKTCRYEPETNPTYAEMARHYDVAVIPARVRKPRDKALAEVSVQIAERWILARLRHRQFFTLAELNAAIRSLVLQLNTKPFRKRPGSRAEVFATLEAAALKALPDAPYEYAQWKRAKIHPDYHVEIDRHYYSVPYPLVGKTVDVRYSNATVEIFHRGKRVASHLRSKAPHDFTTAESHMPPAHTRLPAGHRKSFWSRLRVLDRTPAPCVSRRSATARWPPSWTKGWIVRRQSSRIAPSFTMETSVVPNISIEKEPYHVYPPHL